jgi:hypothetical protein
LLVELVVLVELVAAKTGGFGLGVSFKGAIFKSAQEAWQE